ncbi:hypothetical protein JOQ06_009116 [Pogonophryne albipinna]|uniref:Uncharacterized protein n=1 Tax=Pogonophryne albipinna TaxID=1090488 RepID=A0AAD6BMD9_9TELE|nr:hypothetical protein JOQ06_009116 [Pogonophryne albipinna]
MVSWSSQHQRCTPFLMIHKPPTTTPPPPVPPLAEGHNGNYYLLDVCLISSYSSWLAITGPPGASSPPPHCVIAEGQQWQNNLWST